MGRGVGQSNIGAVSNKGIEVNLTYNMLACLLACLLGNCISFNFIRQQNSSFLQ